MRKINQTQKAISPKVGPTNGRSVYTEIYGVNLRDPMHAFIEI